MYPPPHHQVNDRNKMIEVIKQFPLCMMVTILKGKPYVSHIPLIFNDDTVKLIGHMDRNNPQVTNLQNGDEVQLVFKGPDTYISPSIYTTELLPTWNYIIVHLMGKVRVINEPDRVKKTMVDMTNYLESPDHKYRLELDDPKMDRMINFIHAFEIEISHWEGKFKLSQDKCEQDQSNANEQLIMNYKKEIGSLLNKLLK